MCASGISKLDSREYTIANFQKPAIVAGRAWIVLKFRTSLSTHELTNQYHFDIIMLHFMKNVFPNILDEEAKATVQPGNNESYNRV